jgi:hypothetical protein
MDTGIDIVGWQLLETGQGDSAYEIHIAGWRYWQLLASENGYWSQFLGTGEVDVNSKDSYYGRTSLLLASAENGHEYTYRQLLN